MAGTDPRHNKFIIAVTVDNAAIKVGDAIPVDLGQSKSFTAGTAPLMRAGHEPHPGFPVEPLTAHRPVAHPPAGDSSCPRHAARRAATQTNINAILDALASLGIAHIHIAGHARQLINTGQPEAVRFSGGSQPKTLRPPFACEARRS